MTSPRLPLRPCAILLGLLFLGSAPASAQRGSAASSGGPLSVAVRAKPVRAPAPLPAPLPATLLGARPKILLTGYWPPSNEAVRRFSTSATQNPLGWIGQDWESRGYDVHSYFPEFSPPTCTSCGTGTGDLMVDYQDTTADFWPIVNSLQPIAIVTLSRTNANLSWELEMNTYNNAVWTNDFVAPMQPTPTPPDASVPAGTLRTSTLPMQAIVDDVNAAGLGLNSFICFSQSAGAFVSGYMAYHGLWYQSLHADPQDPAWCIAAGHVHVGDTISWPTAQAATEVTLRTLIQYLDSVRGLNSGAFCAGDGSFVDHTTACPCGNTGAGGRGCGHSFDAAGAQLTATGTPAFDDVVLESNSTPQSSFTLFLQHDAAGDTPFHDGVLCAGGTLIRLRGRPAVGGVASFPNGVFAEDATLTLSQRGQVVPMSGSLRRYAAWYRNASTSFCPPATANVTNGWWILW